MGLEISNLNKTFNNKKVVDNISFSMDNPGVFGLIGSNGAGKTTIIRMILNIINSDSGTIKWNNKLITRKTVNYGYLPEERGIYPKATVKEQLLYFGTLKGMSFLSANKATNNWCEKLGIFDYINTPTEKLSKGNQQKVQLISAIINTPKLLVLDEPFSGLDPINTLLIKEILNNLINTGTYIILSTHQMNIVEEYCKDILLIDKGKSLLQGNLSYIKKSYGNNNIFIETNCNIDSLLGKDIQIVDKTYFYYELKLPSSMEPNLLLELLLKNNIQIKKFHIEEPSLQQIFIEKVGKDK